MFTRHFSQNEEYLLQCQNLTVKYKTLCCCRESAWHPCPGPCLNLTGTRGPIYGTFSRIAERFVTHNIEYYLSSVQAASLLHDVFRATVIAELTYCTPSWSGACSAVTVLSRVIRQPMHETWILQHWNANIQQQLGRGRQILIDSWHRPQTIWAAAGVLLWSEVMKIDADLLESFQLNLIKNFVHVDCWVCQSSVAIPLKLKFPSPCSWIPKLECIVNAQSVPQQGIDGNSTRGGSTPVRGQVRSPHMAKLQAASVPMA